MQRQFINSVWRQPGSERCILKCPHAVTHTFGGDLRISHVFPALSIRACAVIYLVKWKSYYSNINFTWATCVLLNYLFFIFKICPLNWKTQHQCLQWHFMPIPVTKSITITQANNNNPAKMLMAMIL